MIVLDASAVLTVLHDEPGSDVVARELRESAAIIGAANWAEVAGKVVDADGDVRAVHKLVSAVAGVVPVDEADATLAGALRAEPWARPLSLGDRLCLALALRTPEAHVLTADRAWAACSLPLQIHVIR